MISTDELVDWYLLEHREWRQRDQGHTRTGWRASSLGYCLRKQTYQRLGVVPYREFDAQTLRTFSYGDMVHDWMKRIYRNAGVLLAEEGRLALPERDVAGHYDCLLAGRPLDVTDEQAERWSPAWTTEMHRRRAALTEHLDGIGQANGVVIAELKSISEWGLKARRKEGPQKSHQAQVGAYWLMAQADPTQLPAVPTSARIVYIGKDSKSPILEFELEDEWVADVDRTIDQLNEHWAAGTLPPCTCHGWEVGYCDYLKPEARTFLGKPKKDIAGGVDCCPPDLFVRPAPTTEGDQ